MSNTGMMDRLARLFGMGSDGRSDSFYATWIDKIKRGGKFLPSRTSKKKAAYRRKKLGIETLESRILLSTVVAPGEVYVWDTDGGNDGTQDDSLGYLENTGDVDFTVTETDYDGLPDIDFDTATAAGEVASFNSTDAVDDIVDSADVSAAFNIGVEVDTSAGGITYVNADDPDNPEGAATDALHAAASSGADDINLNNASSVLGDVNVNDVDSDGDVDSVFADDQDGNIFIAGNLGSWQVGSGGADGNVTVGGAVTGNFAYVDGLAGNVSIAGSISGYVDFDSNEGGAGGIVGNFSAKSIDGTDGTESFYAENIDGNVNIDDGIAGDFEVGTHVPSGDFTGHLNLDADGDGTGQAGGGDIQVNGTFSSDLTLGRLTTSQRVLVDDWDGGNVTVAGSSGAMSYELILDADWDDDDTGHITQININDGDDGGEDWDLSVHVGDGGLTGGITFVTDDGDELDLALLSNGDVGAITIEGTGDNDLDLTADFAGTFNVNGIDIAGNFGSSTAIDVNSDDPDSDLTQAGNASADIRVDGNIGDILVGGSIYDISGSSGNGTRDLQIYTDNDGDGTGGDIDSVQAGLGGGTGRIVDTTIRAPGSAVGSVMTKVTQWDGSQLVDYNVASTNGATTADVQWRFFAAGTTPWVDVLELDNLGSGEDFGITTRAASTTTDGFDGTDVVTSLDIDNIQVGDNDNFNDDDNLLGPTLNQENARNIFVEGRLLSGIDLDDQSVGSTVDGQGVVEAIYIQDDASAATIEVESIETLALLIPNGSLPFSPFGMLPTLNLPAGATLPATDVDDVDQKIPAGFTYVQYLADGTGGFTDFFAVGNTSSTDMRVQVDSIDMTDADANGYLMENVTITGGDAFWEATPSVASITGNFPTFPGVEVSHIENEGSVGFIDINDLTPGDGTALEVGSIEIGYDTGMVGLDEYAIPLISTLTTAWESATGVGTFPPGFVGVTHMVDPGLDGIYQTPDDFIIGGAGPAGGNGAPGSDLGGLSIEGELDGANSIAAGFRPNPIFGNYTLSVTGDLGPTPGAAPFTNTVETMDVEPGVGTSWDSDIRGVISIGGNDQAFDGIQGNWDLQGSLFDDPSNSNFISSEALLVGMPKINDFGADGVAFDPDGFGVLLNDDTESLYASGSVGTAGSPVAFQIDGIFGNNQGIVSDFVVGADNDGSDASSPYSPGLVGFGQSGLGWYNGLNLIASGTTDGITAADGVHVNINVDNLGGASTGMAAGIVAGNDQDPTVADGPTEESDDLTGSVTVNNMGGTDSTPVGVSNLTGQFAAGDDVGAAGSPFVINVTDGRFGTPSDSGALVATGAAAGDVFMDIELADGMTALIAAGTGGGGSIEGDIIFDTDATDVGGMAATDELNYSILMADENIGAADGSNDIAGGSDIDDLTLAAGVARGFSGDIRMDLIAGLASPAAGVVTGANIDTVAPATWTGDGDIRQLLLRADGDIGHDTDANIVAAIDDIDGFAAVAEGGQVSDDLAGPGNLEPGGIDLDDGSIEGLDKLYQGSLGAFGLAVLDSDFDEQDVEQAREQLSDATGMTPAAPDGDAGEGESIYLDVYAGAQRTVDNGGYIMGMALLADGQIGMDGEGTSTYAADRSMEDLFVMAGLADTGGTGEDILAAFAAGQDPDGTYIAGGFGNIRTSQQNFNVFRADDNVGVDGTPGSLFTADEHILETIITAGTDAGYGVGPAGLPASPNPFVDQDPNTPGIQDAIDEGGGVYTSIQAGLGNSGGDIDMVHIVADGQVGATDGSDDLVATNEIIESMVVAGFSDTLAGDVLVDVLAGVPNAAVGAITGANIGTLGSAAWDTGGGYVDTVLLRADGTVGHSSGNIIAAKNDIVDLALVAEGATVADGTGAIDVGGINLDNVAGLSNIESALGSYWRVNLADNGGEVQDVLVSAYAGAQNGIWNSYLDNVAVLADGQIGRGPEATDVYSSDEDVWDFFAFAGLGDIGGSGEDFLARVQAGYDPDGTTYGGGNILVSDQSYGVIRADDNVGEDSNDNLSDTTLIEATDDIHNLVVAAGADAGYGVGPGGPPAIPTPYNNSGDEGGNIWTSVQAGTVSSGGDIDPTYLIADQNVGATDLTDDIVASEDIQDVTVVAGFSNFHSGNVLVDILAGVRSAQLGLTIDQTSGAVTSGSFDGSGGIHDLAVRADGAVGSADGLRDIAARDQITELALVAEGAVPAVPGGTFSGLTGAGYMTANLGDNASGETAQYIEVDVNAGAPQGGTTQGPTGKDLEIVAAVADAWIGEPGPNGEGYNVWRADHDVTIELIDAGLNDIDTNTTENVLVDIFAGIEYDGITVPTDTVGLTGLPVFSDLRIDYLWADDNVGDAGQIEADGFQATGDVEIHTVRVGGISRNSASGDAEEDLPLANNYDDGGSFLTNVVAGWRGNTSTDADSQAAARSDVDSDDSGSLTIGTVAVDDDLGEVPTLAPGATHPHLPTYPADAGNVLSAAEDVDIEWLAVGQSFTTYTGDSYGQTSSVNNGWDVNNDGSVVGDDGERSVGDLNIDIIAGVEGSNYDPVRGNINDISTTQPGGAFPQLAGGTADLYEDDITFTAEGTNLRVGVNVFDPAYATFIPDDPTTPNIFEGNGNFNATFLAGASVDPDVQIAGNFVGRDGVGGRGLVAAAANLGADFEDPNELVLTGDIAGDFVGSLNSGAFVPFDNSGDSPFNPNDVGPLQAGTVLTLGELDVEVDVGRILGYKGGVVGEDGITLEEALAGTESLADRTFLGTTTFSSTHDSYFDVNVVGRPWSPVEGQGGAGTETPNPADGDGLNISVLSFGEIEGSMNFADSGDFNFVMSNVDAVTAIDTDSEVPGNPTAPSTALPFNAGQAGDYIGDDMELDVTALGAGEGGLEVELLTAGFDPFTRIDTGGAAPTGLQTPTNSVTTAPRTPDFWASFGFGDVDAHWRAEDADPTNGLELGDLSFGLIGAGQYIDGSFVAQDDIIARSIGIAGTDDTPLLPAGLDGDMMAGLSANSGLNPIGAGSDNLFPGGDFEAQIVAGDDIGSTDADGLITLAVQEGPEDVEASGDFDDDFALVSGAEDQLASDALFDNFNGWPTSEGETDPDTDGAGNISAVIIAADDISEDVVIDAGDTQGDYGAVTGGGLGGASGLAGGSFRGGIHAGAGIDLDIMTTGDNEPTGDMEATIRTEGDLNVEDVEGAVLGILAEDDMDEAIIEVGYGPGGGSLLGNVIAEEDIGEIEVWGNVGRPEVDSVIYAGGIVERFGVGNASGIADAGFDDLRDDELYTDGVGTVYSDVYMGGYGTTNGGPALYIGDALVDEAALLVGVNVGQPGLTLEQSGTSARYRFDYGAGVFVKPAGQMANDFRPDVYAYGDGYSQVELYVTGDGLMAGIGKLVSVDQLSDLHVVNGSVGQIVVDDDYDVAADLDAALAGLDVPLDSFPFLTNSLPTVRDIEHSAGNEKWPIHADHINVEGNIGRTAEEVGPEDDPSIGAGLNAAMDNYAIYVEGNLTGSVTSEDGSIGNVVIRESLTSSRLEAQQDIGDIYVGSGGLSGYTNITSHAGSVGLISVQEDISNPTINVAQDLGGLEARMGNVHQVNLALAGDLGMLSAGNDLRDVELQIAGSVGSLVAGDDIDDISADIAGGLDELAAGNNLSTTGDVTLQVDGNVGPISAGNNIAESGYDVELDVLGNIESITAGGHIGDLHVAADGTVGDVSAQGNIHGTEIAAGTIGNLTSTVGDVYGYFIAVDGIGDITAAQDIWGEIVVTNGPLGNLVTTNGDIGRADEGYGYADNNHSVEVSPLVVSVNGGVEIDPYSLEYTHIVNSTMLDGVGTIYAELGDIYLDLETGGSVGLAQEIGIANGTENGDGYETGTQVVGGIAAPLGTIDAELAVGGHVGGLSAQSVHLDNDSVILGSIGLLRGMESGGGTVDNVDSMNPLIIISEDVDYRVEVMGGTASVEYSVYAGSVRFDRIVYDPDYAGEMPGGIQVTTTTGGRTATGAWEDSPEQVTVGEMVVNGTVSHVMVEGDLQNLTVDGSMVNGELHTEGSLGNVDIAGDFGSSNTDSNPFAADDMALIVDEFDPSRFSMDVDGDNYGLVQVSLGKWEWISWQNTLDFNDEGDDYITAFVGNGQAHLTINNGFLQTMQIAGNAARYIDVITSASPMESPNDTSAAFASDDRETFWELYWQSGIVQRGFTSVSGYSNQVFETGSGSDRDNDTAHVGLITGEGGARLAIGDLVIEGDVGSINASATGSAAFNVAVAGDLDELLAQGRVVNADIKGNVGDIDTSLLNGLEVNGIADQVQATLNMANVNVQRHAGIINAGHNMVNVTVDGDAGSVTAGNAMARVKVGGDMLKLSAHVMRDVSVAGSVGYSEYYEGLWSNNYWNPDWLFNELGYNYDDDIAQGGIEADFLANVSVSGSIGDLQISQNGRGFDSLLASTVDDAFVRAGARGNFVMEDGDLIEWPDKLTASEENIVIEIEVDD